MGKIASAAALSVVFSMAAAANEASHLRAAYPAGQDAAPKQDDNVVNAALIGASVGIGVVVLVCMVYFCWRWSNRAASGAETEEAFLRNSFASSGEEPDTFPNFNETPVRSAVEILPPGGVASFHSAALNRSIMPHSESNSSMGILYVEGTPTR